MIELNLLLCFKTIYQNLSLSKAGEKLNLSKASVSKKLASLENELGVKLFVRSTRKICPTKEGIQLFEKVDLILSATDEIESMFQEQVTLRGEIRITAPQSMAISFLGKAVIEFQEMYPEISIEIISTDSVLDVIENGIDLSLRVNPPKNSLLVGKKIGSYGLQLVGTAGYLKKKPVKNLKDLKNHQILAIASHLNEWNEKTALSTLQSSIMSNDSVLIGHLIRSGLALGLRSSWDVDSEIKQAKLIEVLPAYALENCGDIWLLSHPSKSKLARVQALTIFLENKLKHLFK